MNELKIDLKNGGYFYYKTEETSAIGAYDSFEQSLIKSGINYDNVSFIYATLRNNKYEDIDEIDLYNLRQ